MIPERLMGGLLRYRDDKILPGHFLTAVLENNLTKAIGHADDESLAHLKEIVLWVYAELPGDSWGSKEKVELYLYGKVIE